MIAAASRRLSRVGVRVAAPALACALFGACASRPHRPTIPRSTVGVGSCADPARDGVVGAHPHLEHADRDLNGDGRPELVVADRSLCTAAGNCRWNIFTRRAGTHCYRYIGTVSAKAIEALPERDEDGFHELRGWWALTGRGRMLLQEYQFRYGGYRIQRALLCRRQEDRVICGRDGGHALSPAGRDSAGGGE